MIFCLFETRESKEHLKLQGYFIYTIKNFSVKNSGMIFKSYIFSGEYLPSWEPQSESQETYYFPGTMQSVSSKCFLNLACPVSFRLRCWRAWTILETQDNRKLLGSDSVCLVSTHACLHTHAHFLKSQGSGLPRGQLILRSSLHCEGQISSGSSGIWAHDLEIAELSGCLNPCDEVLLARQ